MIFIRADQRMDGLEITAVGHAGYATRGQDVVCAGVSALLFGLLSYLVAASSDVGMRETVIDGYSSGDCQNQKTALAHLRGSVERRVEDGSLWLLTHDMHGVDMTAWSVTAAGLALIAKQYPGHVRLETGKEANHGRSRQESE